MSRLKVLQSSATAAVCGLSAPSKMPGFGYSLPASACITGAKLARVPGSTCHGCYAMRGNYLYGNVQAALHRRLWSISDPMWVPNMVQALEEQYTRQPQVDRYFRWHDSGDLQSVDHLRAIVAVAELTPWLKHWLPTREYAIVARYQASGGTFPDNLCVRLSAHMIDGPAPSGYGLPTSGVHKEEKPRGSECPAPKQGNSCQSCRACWGSRVAHVSYHKH